RQLALVDRRFPPTTPGIGENSSSPCKAVPDGMEALAHLFQRFVPVEGHAVVVGKHQERPSQDGIYAYSVMDIPTTLAQLRGMFQGRYRFGNLTRRPLAMSQTRIESTQ